MSLILPQGIKEKSVQKIPAFEKEEIPTSSLINSKLRNSQVSHLVHCIFIRFHGERLSNEPIFKRFLINILLNHMLKNTY